jgi:hypothetical protein
MCVFMDMLIKMKNTLRLGAVWWSTVVDLLGKYTYIFARQW